MNLFQVQAVCDGLKANCALWSIVIHNNSPQGFNYEIKTKQLWCKDSGVCSVVTQGHIYFQWLPQHMRFPHVSNDGSVSSLLSLCSLGWGPGHGHDLLLLSCGQHVHRSLRLQEDRCLWGDSGFYRASHNIICKVRCHSYSCIVNAFLHLSALRHTVPRLIAL